MAAAIKAITLEADIASISANTEVVALSAVMTLATTIVIVTAQAITFLMIFMVCFLNVEKIAR